MSTKFAILWAVDHLSDDERQELIELDDLTPEALEDLVGGELKELPLADGCVMYVRCESEKPDRKPNIFATIIALADQAIEVRDCPCVRGTALVLGPTDTAGKMGSVPEAMLVRLGLHLGEGQEPTLLSVHDESDLPYEKARQALETLWWAVKDDELGGVDKAMLALSTPMENLIEEWKGLQDAHRAHQEFDGEKEAGGADVCRADLMDALTTFDEVIRVLRSGRRRAPEEPG